MKIFKKISVEIVLPFLLAWFLMTVLVDIVTVPTVFRNSTNIVDAGKIGMIVFGRFNTFELAFSLFILIGALVNFKVLKNKKWIVMATPLVFWACLYKFYMTPMITATTYEIHKTEVSDPRYVELQSQHAYYHTMYKSFDSAKLIYLLVFMGVVLSDRVKSNKEII